MDQRQGSKIQVKSKYRAESFKHEQGVKGKENGVTEKGITKVKGVWKRYENL